MAQRNSQTGGSSQFSQEPRKSEYPASGRSAGSVSASTLRQPASYSPGQAAGTTVKDAPPRSYKRPSLSRPSHEQIATRARAIWQAAGCRPGRDLENWMEAEAQLKREMGLV